MKKKIIGILIVLLLTHNVLAKNLFKSNFTLIEFQSDNIEFKKNQEINNLKKTNLNLIFKNILTEQNYNIIKKYIDDKFANKFVRNIIIEDEKIINNTYSANIKIDLSKKLIIKFLRQNQYSYVDYIPKNFFTIILEKKEIETNLFTKNNSYYNFLINNKKTMKFFKIPNLDLNDRFLVSSNDFINKDYKKIKKFIDKYEYENNVIIYSSYKNNKYIYELYTIKDDSLFLFDKYSSQDLIYNNYFNDLNARLINFWKNNNNIQNNSQTILKCNVSALNIYELKKINSLIKSISAITSINLNNIKLYNNNYEIKFYGNKSILKKLFYNSSMNLTISENNCNIKLI